MDYDVLTSRVLVPNFHFFNEDGANVFVVHDLSPEWRGKARPAGSYRSSVVIPGNSLAEGTLIVRAAMSTHDPLSVHFNEPEVVAFQIVDSFDGDPARGDYAGPMPGIVRPLLEWTTAVIKSGGVS